MINEWSTFSADDSRHCAAEATMGGESSYTDLLTCLEMARDVRKLHGEAHSASAPGSAPPPAPGRRQPTSSFAPRPTQVPGEGEGIEQNLLRRPAVTVRERGAFPVCGRFACTEPLLGTERTERYTAHTTIDIGVLAEQLRRRPSLFLEMPYLLHLLSSSESMDMNSSASLDFGSTRSNPSINLKYSGPSLSISASACLVSISTVLGSVVG
jgi:hypothetical protein